MDDVVEMHLSRAVSVTNTKFIRASIRDQIEEEDRSGPPVELMRFHVFIHCTRGNGLHMVDFEDYEMKPGTTIWIRPGQVQRWSNTHDDFDANVVVFESSIIPDLPLFDHFIGTTSVVHFDEDAEQLRRLMEWMAADLEMNQDQATAASVVGVILRLFARQSKFATEFSDTSRRRLAAAFVESVDRNIGQRSVAWHAQQVGASTRSVARATVESLNQRPKEVVDARVILEAQRRLAWSNDDVATIARDLQFSEASNFTKFFRSRTGTAPSAFRATVTSLGGPDRKPQSQPGK